MAFIDRKFKKNKTSYFFQCGMATLTILGILLYFDSVEQGAIIASLGASTFICFTMPRAYNSSARRLLGGYSVCILIGVLFKLLSGLLLSIGILTAQFHLAVLCGSAAVGIAMFLMIITNTEHPPACGMALALVLNNWTLLTIVFIVTSVLWLFVVKTSLLKLMIDFRDLPGGEKSTFW